MSPRPPERPLFDWPIVRRATVDAVRKLDPRHLLRNPVMFVVEVGAVLTTALWVVAATGHGEDRPGFVLAIALWLWVTVLFANFAEARAEGRGKAQADALRRGRREGTAKKLARAGMSDVRISFVLPSDFPARRS